MASEKDKTGRGRKARPLQVEKDGVTYASFAGSDPMVSALIDALRFGKPIDSLIGASLMVEVEKDEDDES